MVKKIAVLFGGRSGEHAVSLRSAAFIMDMIDRDRYQVIPVGITRQGQWLAGEDAWESLMEQRPGKCVPALISTDPSRPGLFLEEGGSWRYQPVDLVFPVLHGPYGEDGTVQGLLEMARLPYVGSGVLGSSVSMDKAVMKALFIQNGLPVGPFLQICRWEWEERRQECTEKILSRLKLPCFVKPANLGSSVGISRVDQEEGLAPAIQEAFLYDEKILVEALIRGREIECSVLGNEKPEASLPGEIIPCNQFYDYRAKYLDDRSQLIIPAQLDRELVERVQELAIKAFQAVNASGLARVDFFVEPETGSVVLNEINTMPGFTSISMYPKLWEASGVSARELVNRLIELGLERFRRRQQLRTEAPE